LYGLASILIKLFKEDRPDYVAALFDRPEPTFREKKYPAYKAQRPPTADALVFQLHGARNLFGAFGVKTFEKSGYEADDLIATFSEAFKFEKDLQIVILTGDRDTLQLVSGDAIVVQTFKKGVSDTTIYDEARVFEKYGIKPLQIIDYKALAGDSSDNIKGVPGVGPKTAIDLVQKFGSVENLYLHTGEDPKLDKKVRPFKSEAMLSKELVTLDRAVPIAMPMLDDLALPQSPAVEDYFTKMGFASLMKRVDAAPVEKKKKDVPKSKNSQQAMF
jgi:DNA polymerase-1